MIPSVVVYLMKIVVILTLGIVLLYEFFFRDSQRSIVRLRYEVITIVRIRIAHAIMLLVPTHRALCIEQSATVDIAGRDFFQIVESHEFVAHEFLIL